MVVEPAEAAWEDDFDAVRTYGFAGFASLGIPGVSAAADEEWDVAAAVRQPDGSTNSESSAHSCGQMSALTLPPST